MSINCINLLYVYKSYTHEIICSPGRHAHRAEPCSSGHGSFLMFAFCVIVASCLAAAAGARHESCQAGRRGRDNLDWKNATPAADHEHLPGGEEIHADARMRAELSSDSHELATRSGATTTIVAICVFRPLLAPLWAHTPVAVRPLLKLLIPSAANPFGNA